MIGDLLRDLREQKNLTQKHVASQISCSAKMISQFELNQRRPDYETLKKLCGFYKVNADYLIGLSPYPKNYVKLTAMQNELLLHFDQLPDTTKVEFLRLIRFALSEINR